MCAKSRVRSRWVRVNEAITQCTGTANLLFVIRREVCEP